MSVIFIGLETDPENNYPDPQLCFNQCQYPQHCLCLCVQEFPDSDERGGAVRGGKQIRSANAQLIYLWPKTQIVFLAYVLSIRNRRKSLDRVENMEGRNLLTAIELYATKNFEHMQQKIANTESEIFKDYGTLRF